MQLLSDGQLDQLTGACGNCKWPAEKPCPTGEAKDCEPDDGWCWVVEVLDVPYICTQLTGYDYCTKFLFPPFACCTYGQKWEKENGCDCSGEPDGQGPGGCDWPYIQCPGKPTCPFG